MIKLRRLGVLAGGSLAALALALVATVSPAEAWTPPGAHTWASNNTVSTLDLAGNPELACTDISLDTTLSTGSGNAGTVDDGYADSCTTTVDPDCVVTVTLHDLPWTIAGTHTSGGDGTVIISGIRFDVLYGGGAPCPLNNVYFRVVGSVTGDYDYQGASLPGVLTITSSSLDVSNSNATSTIPNGTDVTMTGDFFTGPVAPALQ